MFCTSHTHYPYEFLRPADQIVQIQLLHTEDCIGLYNHALEEIPTMLDETTTVVTELEPSKHAVFLSDFTAVPCHKTSMDPSSCIDDETILIFYTDGSREWIAANGTYYHDTRSGEASMTEFYFEDPAFGPLLRSYGYS